MYSKIRWKFPYYLQNLQKLFEMRSPVFNAKLTTLWYRCTNWLVGLNLNIPVNARECFRLTDVWATLHSSSSTWRIRPSGLFPFGINLELLLLYTIGRTPWTGDQPCHKAATYTRQHKHRKHVDIHPCLEWNSNPRSQYSGQTIIFHALERTTTVIGW
jgi:hypothetical protein